MIDIKYIRNHDCILFECISGSRAYGLDIASSDTDIKGVFVMPKEKFYGLNYVEQITHESNDVVFYELRRFFELLSKNNPNIIELLGTPEDSIVYRHPLFDLDANMFLSKLCRQTFANYAYSQIKKAKGLNKKINKPVDKERKDILHFCHVIRGNGSQPLIDWLQSYAYDQSRCGLAAINHMRDVYAVYYDPTSELGYQGIMRGESSNDVSLSSIPKDAAPVGYLHFNKDGYSSYCKDYKEYWEWVEKRNEARYTGNLEHGKNYDSKNMMHVFRLLDMAEEIAEGKGIITRRPNREYLLSIRQGKYSYEELVELAEQRIQKIDMAYERSSLPEEPDQMAIDRLLYTLRDRFYAQ